MLGLKVNGVSVFDERGESETWSSAMLSKRMLKTFGDKLIKEVEIQRLKATSQVATEFIDAIIQKDTVATGYEKFHLRRFLGMKDLFEETVVERLLEKLTHVKDL